MDQGGIFSSDRRIRRVGWAWTQVLDLPQDEVRPHTDKDATGFYGNMVIHVQGYTYSLIHGLGGLGFGEFPRLVGRYCTCLLPRQDSGTSQIHVHPTHVAAHMNTPVQGGAGIRVN